MHNRSVILAQDLNIPIKVSLSPSLGQSTGGTFISHLSTLDNMEKEIKETSLAIQNPVGLINISLPNIPKSAAKVFAPFKEHNINIIDSTHAQGEKVSLLSILVQPEKLSKAVELLKKIPDISVKAGDTFAAITIIDSNMASSPGFFAEATDSLGDAEINVEMLSSSGNSILLVVQKNQLKKAAETLAKTFDLIS